MMKAIFVALLVTAKWLTVVNANGAGVPVVRTPGVCATMAPDQSAHSAPPQTGAHTYTVEPSKTTFSPGETITVTLNSTDSANFRGVFVQARLADRSNTAAQGVFALTQGDSELKLENCGTAESAVSHSSNADKITKTVQWTAPSTAIGNIKFRATFVQTRQVYWVGVESEELISAATTMAPTTTTESGAESPIGAKIAFILSPILLTVVLLKFF